VQRPEFGATPKRRDRFAGVEKTVGVEGAFDGLELLKLLGRELDTHLVQLLDPHAVLSGDGATGERGGIGDDRIRRQQAA